MSYSLAWRFWYFANDNGHRPRRWKQDKPPDYPPALHRLEITLAVLRGENSLDDDEFP